MGIDDKSMTPPPMSLSLHWHRPQQLIWQKWRNIDALRGSEWTECTPLVSQTLWSQFALRDPSKDQIFQLTLKYGFLKNVSSSRWESVVWAIQTQKDATHEMHLLWLAAMIIDLIKTRDKERLQSEMYRLLLAENLWQNRDLAPFLAAVSKAVLAKETKDKEVFDYSEDAEDDEDIPEEVWNSRLEPVGVPFFMEPEQVKEPDTSGVQSVVRKQKRYTKRDIDHGLSYMIWTADVATQAVNALIKSKIGDMKVEMDVMNATFYHVPHNLLSGLWYQLALFSASAKRISVCPQCGSIIHNPRKNKVYCGNTCVQAAIRERNRSVTTVSQRRPKKAVK